LKPHLFEALRTGKVYSDTDIKYLKMAELQSKLSKAVNRKVGAVIVRANTVVSTGYNGPPRGIREKNNWTRFNFNDECPDHSPYVKIIQAAEKKYGEWEPKDPDEAHPDVYYDPRYLLGYKSGFGMKLMIDAHAERNAIINAARLGVSTVDSTIYCWCGLPCKECMIELINAGIARIVCLYEERSQYETTSKLRIDEISDYNFFLSRWLCEEAGIELVEIPEQDVIDYEL
jgi:dCMP deaminase